MKDLLVICILASLFVCLFVNFKGAIVSAAREATIDEYPYHCFLISIWNSDLGDDIPFGRVTNGLVLGLRWILTTAQHVESFLEGGEPTFIKVRLGVDHLENQYGYITDVDYFDCHEKFNSRTLMHDVCLMRTRDELPFSHTVKPILLPFFVDDRYSLVRAPLNATGFGTLNVPEARLRLKHYELIVRPSVECVKQHNDIGFNEEYQLCAAVKKDRRLVGAFNDRTEGPCGGEAVFKDGMNGDIVAVGMVSRAFCNSSVMIITRVAVYVDWILFAREDILDHANPGLNVTDYTILSNTTDPTDSGWAMHSPMQLTLLPLKLKAYFIVNFSFHLENWWFK